MVTAHVSLWFFVVVAVMSSVSGGFNFQPYTVASIQGENNGYGYGGVWRPVNGQVNGGGGGNQPITVGKGQSFPGFNELPNGHYVPNVGRNAPSGGRSVPSGGRNAPSGGRSAPSGGSYAQFGGKQTVNWYPKGAQTYDGSQTRNGGRQQVLRKPSKPLSPFDNFQRRGESDRNPRPGHPSQRSTSSPAPETPSPSLIHGKTIGDNLPDDACDGCRFANGIYVNPHPTICNRFVLCSRLNSTHFRGTSMSCEPGRFYNEGISTCDYPYNVDCLNDPCRGSELRVYQETPDDCRYFGVCMDGRTQEFRSCISLADDPEYRPLLGECVNTAACTPPTTSPTSPVTTPCRVQPQCSQNEVFDRVNCRCVRGDVFINTVSVTPRQLSSVAPTGSACHPDLVINFFQRISQPGVFYNQVPVQYNVEGTNRKVGVFNGMGYVSVERYDSSRLQAPIAVTTRFRPNTRTNFPFQAVVTNSDYQHPASIAIAVGSNVVEIGICTTTYGYTSLQIPFANTEWQTVGLLYDGHKLLGQVGNTVAEKRLTVMRRPVPFVCALNTFPRCLLGCDMTNNCFDFCLADITMLPKSYELLKENGQITRGDNPILIGKGWNYQNFQGQIDYVKFYLCNPDP